MKFFLLPFALAVLLAGCGNSTNVSGPSVDVHCNDNIPKEAKIGGDTSVDVKCPSNSDNPVTNPAPVITAPPGSTVISQGAKGAK